MGGGGNRQCQTHTHTVSPVIHTMDGASGNDRKQLDTCRRSQPLIKLMGYEQREDAVGVGGSRQGKHTHTHTQCPSSYTVWMEPRARIGHNLDTCRRGPPQIKLTGYEHREDSLGGGVAGKGKYTHKHTHTHSVHHDTQGGWSHGQGSDTILTHVGVATPLIK